MAGEDRVILNAKNIIKKYPSFTLDIDDFSLDGDVYFLLGPNGAGKTTLLRILSGLERVYKGEVHFKGKEIINTRKPFNGGIYPELSYFPSAPILWNESVKENVSYGLKLRKLPGHIINEKVIEISDKLQISHLLKKSARELSSGENQIVALARMLVLEPELLFLDEPTANLDVKKTVLLEETLLEYQKSKNAAIFWATHNLFQAKRLAEFIFFIWDGRIIESGEVEVFFKKPRTTELKAFLQGKFY